MLFKCFDTTLAELADLRGDGGDVDHFQILPVYLNLSNTFKHIIVVFSNNCQKNWIVALSLHVKQTEPER